MIPANVFSSVPKGIGLRTLLGVLEHQCTETFIHPCPSENSRLPPGLSKDRTRWSYLSPYTNGCMPLLSDLQSVNLSRNPSSFLRTSPIRSLPV